MSDGRHVASDRARDTGALHLVSTFLGSFPPMARWTQERQLASLDRVCEDGVLTLQIERRGSELVLRASGELDIASAKKLEDELAQAINGNASAIVLDLGGLTFIDSCGLHVLVFAAKLSATNGTPLRMVRASEPVRGVIEMSGLGPSLPLAA